MLGPLLFNSNRWLSVLHGESILLGFAGKGCMKGGLKLSSGTFADSGRNYGISHGIGHIESSVYWSASSVRMGYTTLVQNESNFHTEQNAREEHYSHHQNANSPSAALHLRQFFHALTHKQRVHLIQLYMLHENSSPSKSDFIKYFFSSQEIRNHPAFDTTAFDEAWRDAKEIQSNISNDNQQSSLSLNELSHMKQNRNKQLIQQLILDHSADDTSQLTPQQWTREKLYHVHKLTGLSMSQIKMQIRYLSDRPGKITPAIKESIELYLSEKNLLPNSSRTAAPRPTSQDIDALQELTQLSRNQIRKQVLRLTDPPGKLTRKRKLGLRDHLSKHNITDYSEISQEMFQTIRNMFGLSKNQVRMLMHRVTKTLSRSASILSSEQKQQALSKLREVQNSHDGMEYLPHVNLVDMIQVCLSPPIRMQQQRNALSRFIKYHIHSQNKITFKTKRIVQKALEENGMQMIRGDEMRALVKLTKVDTIRLHKLMSDVLNQPSQQSISPVQRAEITQWIEEKYPNGLDSVDNKEVIDELKRNNLFLSQNQAVSIIRKLRDPNKVMTPEKRSIIKEWLERHEYRKPSTAEYQELRENSGLSKMQVYKLVSYIREKEGEKK